MEDGKFTKKNQQIAGPNTAPSLNYKDFATKKNNGLVGQIINSASPAAQPSSQVSREFKAFWGAQLQAQWFERGKLPSLPSVILALLSLVVVFCSVRLLFSPEEFQDIFFTPPDLEQQVREAEKLGLINVNKAEL